MANEKVHWFCRHSTTPPIMVPEVGLNRCPVRQSIDGMAELTERIIDSAASTVILYLLTLRSTFLRSSHIPGQMLLGTFPFSKLLHQMKRR